MAAVHKGKRAEREAVHLLQPIMDLAYHECGQEPPFIQRNTIQAHRGGADLVFNMGTASRVTPFLAVEVKHHKKPHPRPWWAQTLEQLEGRLPLLMYKSNYVDWRFQMYWDAHMGDDVEKISYNVTNVSKELGLYWVYLRTVEFLNFSPKKSYSELFR